MTQTWRQFLDAALALHEHRPHSRFVALATVRPDGRPANRTVTFRGFISRDRLLLTSDARADKISELKAMPWAELCWYFPESRQQFRLSGEIQIPALSDAQETEISEARQRIWQERPEHFRQSFTWPAPKQERSPDSAFQAQAPAAPHDNFAVLILEPKSVEMLDLRPAPHERHVFRRESGGWKQTEVNP